MLVHDDLEVPITLVIFAVNCLFIMTALTLVLLFMTMVLHHVIHSVYIIVLPQMFTI